MIFPVFFGIRSFIFGTQLFRFDRLNLGSKISMIFLKIFLVHDCLGLVEDHLYFVHDRLNVAT